MLNDSRTRKSSKGKISLSCFARHTLLLLSKNIPKLTHTRPCIVVRELISNFGKTEIQELMSDDNLQFNLSTCDSENKWMSLQPKKLEKLPDFFLSPRVGLSMKTKFEKHNPFEFVMRNHRFLTIKPTKGKAYFFSSLIHTGHAKLDKFINLKVLEETKKNIEKGRKMTPKDFYGSKADSDSEIATLFGFTKTQETN